MKTFVNIACMLLAIAGLTSCLGADDDDSVYYNDAAITAFSLGTLNRTMHTTSSAGEDSTYTTTVTGSSYTFCIDQANRLVFNPDSLPLGTDAEKVVCTISTKNSGVVVFKNVDSDTLKYYTSTDSIDFTQPREVRVYATDGQSYQVYTVKVNVHQQDGDVFGWTQMPDNSQLAALTGMKALALGGRVFVFGSDGETTVGFATGDGTEWTTLSPNVNTRFEADAYKQTVASADSLYMLNGNVLFRTADGSQWDEIGQTTAVTRLVGASKKELYGMDADGALMVSRDGGHEWQAETLDASASLLPSASVATACYPMSMADSTDYVIMAGNSVAETDAAVVWRKIAEYDYHSEPGQWAYIEVPGNRYKLPQLNDLALVPYDDGVLAFGTVNGNFTTVYQSRDNGITWKSNKTYQLPDGFDTSVTRYSVTSDGVNIWLFGGKNGEVWRGRLNRLAW